MIESVDIIIIFLVLVCVGLCAWVLLLKTKVEQLEGYRDRVELERAGEHVVDELIRGTHYLHQRSPLTEGSTRGGNGVRK